MTLVVRPAHVVAGPPTSGSAPRTAVFQDGATALSVVLGHVDGRLYRVSTPPGHAPSPTVKPVGSIVYFGLHGSGDAREAVVLDASVPWTVRFEAGATRASVDAAHGRLRGLVADQGISTLTVRAGDPDGRVVLTERGGATAFTLRTPSHVPVAVHVRGGAGSVDLFGVKHTGVAAGSTFAVNGTGAESYTIDAVGGVSTITVVGG